MRYVSGWMRPPRFVVWVASIFALFGTLIARAQAPQSAPAPPIIRSVDVQYTGAQAVSKERILAQMRTKVRQPYCNQAVEHYVPALYKTGAIQHVHIAP